MTNREGIEIDYCPTCRGVWLDRGELDKILERGTEAPAASSTYREPDARPYRDSGYRDSHHGKRKKEGFLGEIFDF